MKPLSILLIFLLFQPAIYAQTEQERKQLLEERQIARMILMIQEQRDTIASHEKESARLNELVNNLDAQVSNLTRIADLHKAAADERLKALELYKQAETIYKDSLKDAAKEIDKLNRRVSFWQKAAAAAFVIGALFGFAVKSN
jgi:hypothetical protein